MRERFGDHPFIDSDRICRAIELTRFPVPESDDYLETNTEAGLLRAADLIGQLADPCYSRKLNALFHEFVEFGCNAHLGYTTPADLAEHYPKFFWTKVEPFIGDALGYLELTVGGRSSRSSMDAAAWGLTRRRFAVGRPAQTTDGRRMAS